MFTFLNTILLIGLLGVAIPALIHLFARQKVRQVLFSSTAFLKQIQSQKLRRMRLRQILLLVLRSAAVLFLVLAFARPTWKTRHGRGRGRGSASTSMVVALDRSMSMGRPGQLQEALQKAGTVLDLCEEEDEIALIEFPGSHTSGAAFARSPGSIRQALAEDVTWLRGDGLKELERAITLLESSQNINQEIYLITDMQASAFSPGEDSLRSFDWDGRLFVLPVSGEEANAAVVRGGIESRILQPNAPLGVYAEIKNFGDNRIENVLVRAFIGDNPGAQQLIDLDPGESRRVLFRVIPDQPGWFWGVVRIEADALPADNDWFFTCFIPERLRVLMLGKTLADTRPFRVVLDLHPGRDGWFEIEQAVYGESFIDRMDDFDVLIMSNYPMLRMDEANRLKKYVENGGGLFVWMGEDVNLRNYSSMLCRPVLGFDLGNVSGKREDGGYLNFGTVDYGHPLFRGVFEEGKENIRSPRIYSIIDMIGPAAQRIISLGNGHPFLIEGHSGKGRVLFVTGAASDGWSDIVYSTVFAPLVIRSAIYLGTSTTFDTEDRRTGDELVLNLRGGDVQAPFHVELPGGEEVRLSPVVSGDGIRLASSHSERPGLYRFYQGNRLLQSVSVNVDSRESDLQHVSENIWERLLPGARTFIVEDDEVLKRLVSQNRRGHEFWRSFLIILMLILAVEMVIARESRKK